MQRVHFVVDNFDSAQQAPTCECKRSVGAVCTCTEVPCHCNHLRYDTVYITLPTYFTQSRNANKRIHIQQVKLFDITSDEPTEINASMHSDIVQINASADNYCCFCNALYPIPPTFTLSDNKSKFECWFRDLKGNLVDIDPTKVRLILETVLEY